MAAGRGGAELAAGRAASGPSPAELAASRTQAAFKARRRAARWGAFQRAARWAAPAVVLAGAAALLWLSPVFAVRAGDIEINGLGGWIDRAEVSRVLAKEVGVPLVRVSPSQIEARLLELTPIKAASVERAWPTGLTVRLEPRRAAAAVQDGAEYVLLDAEAAVVIRVDQPPQGLPIIAVPLTDGNRRTVESVLRVAASLPEWLTAQVASLGAETEDTVTLTLAGGVVVAWGDSSNGALKAAAVEVLLKEPNVNAIDVTAPEFPVVR
ncbi:MAG: cell division protein FtsQ/DivIB [Bifidobacteriaceae bacterium]|nr:cell division protein FtsQ/DivIB [Bifidobacteriaceae bacterium]